MSNQGFIKLGVKKAKVIIVSKFDDFNNIFYEKTSIQILIGETTPQSNKTEHLVLRVRYLYSAFRYWVADKRCYVRNEFALIEGV